MGEPGELSRRLGKIKPGNKKSSVALGKGKGVGVHANPLLAEPVPEHLLFSLFCFVALVSTLLSSLQALQTRINNLNPHYFLSLVALSQLNMSPMSSDELPWVEKHRPASLDQVEHQRQVIASLQAMTRSGHLPHLLFYGPPGVGKTTTALAMARNLFGPHWRTRTRELNASDQRGIHVVRTQIKHYASLAIDTSLTLSEYAPLPTRGHVSTPVLPYFIPIDAFFPNSSCILRPWSNLKGIALGA